MPRSTARPAKTAAHRSRRSRIARSCDHLSFITQSRMLSLCVSSPASTHNGWIPPAWPKAAAGRKTASAGHSGRRRRRACIRTQPLCHRADHEKPDQPAQTADPYPRCACRKQHAGQGGHQQGTTDDLPSVSFHPFASFLICPLVWPHLSVLCQSRKKKQTISDHLPALSMRRAPMANRLPIHSMAAMIAR